MIAVVDASVVLKWLFQDPKRVGTEKAIRLMAAIASGEQAALQPIHWVAEVGAVSARESSESAPDDVTMLCALELPTADDPLLLRRAGELAIELEQHLFDTLYHASRAGGYGSGYDPDHRRSALSSSRTPQGTDLGSNGLAVAKLANREPVSVTPSSFDLVVIAGTHLHDRHRADRMSGLEIEPARHCHVPASARSEAQH